MRLHLLALAWAVMACSRSHDPNPSPDAGPAEASAAVAVLRSMNALPIGASSAPRALDARVPASSRAAVVISAARHSGATVAITPEDVDDVAARSVEDAIVFPGAAKGADIVWTSTPTMVEELRLLHRPIARYSARYRLAPGPAIAAVRLREGHVECVDETGYVQLSTAHMFALDSKGERRDLTPRLLNENGNTILVVEGSLEGMTAPIAIDPVWTALATMNESRSTGLTAARFSDGRILAVGGGYTGSVFTSTAELYDPGTNTWSTVPSAPGHLTKRPAVFPSGRAIGWSSTPVGFYAFNLGSKTWSTLSPQPTITGWDWRNIPLSGGRALYYSGALRAVFNDTTSSWSYPKADPETGRSSPAMVELPDGRLFVAGGNLGSTVYKLSSAEIYDFATDSWTSIAPLPSRRYQGFAFNWGGKVVVAGGFNAAEQTHRGTDIYDPATGTWTTYATGNGPPGDSVTLASPRVQVGSFVFTGDAIRPWVLSTSIGGLYLGTTGGQIISIAGQLTTGVFTATNLFTPLVAGAACTTTYPGDCLKPYCEGGICCDRTCTGTCERCDATGSVGTCTSIAGPPPTTFACEPYASCTSTGCATSCTSNADCTALYACDGGKCVKKKLNGEACTVATVCGSGRCVDGVCCDAACTGQCEACNVPGTEGKCVAVTGAPRPPHAPCADAGKECGTVCNGATRTACVYLPAGKTPCGANACVDGVETHASTCDGTGKCADAPKSCGNYACGIAGCKSACSTRADCAAGFVCVSGACVTAPGLGSPCVDGSSCSTGFCVDGVCCGVAACGAGSACNVVGHRGSCIKAAGVSCSTGAECGTGKCVDGVCCEGDCTGQCEACDVPGQAGKCTPVRGAPRAGKPACATDGTNACANRVCNGTDGKSCAGYAGAEIECRAASCATGEATPAATCDGKGACPAPTKVSCGGYACDAVGSRCREVCATDEGCAAEHQCIGGKCLVRRAACSDDGLAAFAADGTLTRCAPFRCKGGSCATSCATTDDCSPGSLCDPSGKCVAPNAADGGDGGCTMSPRAGVTPWWLLGIVIAAVARLRVRRRASLSAAALALLACSPGNDRGAPGPTGNSRDVLATLASNAAIASRMISREHLVVDGSIIRGSRVSLPTHAAGATTLRSPHDETVSVAITATDLEGRPAEIDGGRVVYRDARRSTDVVLVARADGYEELRLLRTADAPANARWRLHTGAGIASASIAEGRVLLRDARGAVVISTEPMFAVDVRGTVRTPALTLERDGDDWSLAASFDVRGLEAPIAIDPAWSTGVETIFAYYKSEPGRVATRNLSGGDVLLFGSTPSNIYALNAERWTPSTGAQRTMSPNMYHIRRSAIAELPADKVLVAGGNSTSNAPVTTVDIYDPAMDKWTVGPSMAAARHSSAYAMMTAPVSRFLVAGGFGAAGAPLATVEIYDPIAGTWSAGPAAPTARFSATAVPLANAKVLVLGGRTDTTPDGSGATWVKTVELYDGVARTWSTRAPMLLPHNYVSTAVLPSGKVLVVGAVMGGTTGTAVNAASSGEIYDPTTDTWTATGNFRAPRRDAILSLLSNGRVLLTGGMYFTPTTLRTSLAEVYEPANNTWIAGGDLLGPRQLHQAGALPDGRVFLFGGEYATNDAAFRIEYFSLLANAAACTAPGECNSAACVDGVCCDRACTGACEACNATGSVGTCSPISGTPLKGHPSCAPYKTCSAGACASSCATDADCCGTSAECCTGSTCPSGFAGSYCVAGSCVAKKANGAAASAGRECASGFAIDSVCCDVACAGQCEACDVTGKVGTCSVIAGTPRPSRTPCEASASAECKARCDGVTRGICTYPAATVACGADACVSGVETHRRFCDGLGRCGDVPKACGAYVCGTSTCKTTCATAADCIAGFSCMAGACVPAPGLGSACSSSKPCDPALTCLDGVCCGSTSCPSGTKCNLAASPGTCAKDNGNACATSAECGSGSCVDGYCCDAPCNGQCQACDVAGQLGKCVPVQGKPHGARLACRTSADRPCESTLCDGSDGSRCAALVGSDVACRAAKCSDGALIAAASCNGTGACPAEVKAACAPFGCPAGGTACATSCKTLDDCAPGFLCNDGACVKPTSRCSDDARSVIDATGRAAPCAPLKCREGACIERCATSDDCIAGTICDGAGKCVLAPTADAAAPDEGGCVYGVGSRAGPGAALALIASALLARARRRRP